jgi:hypothetical protein|tara:strand:- start:468 stop:1001 length:534 start_codon:yes stop_codon:yes gene_type:complete
MDKLKELRYKKTRQQLRYLQTELEETKLVYEDCVDKFNQDFSEELMKDNDPHIHEEVDNPYDIIDSDVEDDVIHDIYKKIALRVHPDKKTGNEEKFKLLNKANKNKDYGAMLEMADELNIMETIPTDEHSYNQMKKQIRGVIENIKGMQMTFAWQWEHIEEKQKPAYRDYILKQMEL